jgi:glycosyltransferase involved in cell wall biosynthesis
MPPNADVAIVIPAKDESDRIQATVKAAAELPGADVLIVVDDGSRDDSAAAAEAAGAMVLRHPRRSGCWTGPRAVRYPGTCSSSTPTWPSPLAAPPRSCSRSATAGPT